MRNWLTQHHRWYSVHVYSTTSAAEVDRSIQYAHDWKYDGIQFDLAKDPTATRELVVRSVFASRAFGEWSTPVLFRVAASEAQDFLRYDHGGQAFWNIVFHLPMEEPLARAQVAGLRAAQNLAVTFRFLPGTELVRVRLAMSSLRDAGHKKVHFEFPFQSAKAHHPWSETAISDWVTTLRAEFPGVEILPPIGWGLEDPDIPSDEALFPEPVMVRGRVVADAKEPKISVIIPTYQKAVEILNTLRHLLRQRLSRHDFEVIIVDCGSFDSTIKDVEKFIDGEGRGVTVRLIQLPRTSRRRMGDHRFRAALARNVGASVARAPILSFLDDDMLTPKDYLERVVEKFDSDFAVTPVVMARRLDLKSEVFGVRLAWEKVNPRTDVEINDRGLWREFYNQFALWMKFARPWRFVCTHSLSLRAKDFFQVGWFRENFTSYGYEDGELGWRLAHFGAKFEVLEVDLYHQNRGPQATEYGGEHRAKLILLSSAAKVFWRHTLHPDVYTQVKYLFRQPLWLWLIWDDLLMGGPFWRYRRRQIELASSEPRQ